MKTFIILVLAIGLGAAAFFTRPTQKDFEQYIIAQQTKDDTNWLTKTWDKSGAEHFAKQCQFNDRYLWVSVEKDGKTVFTGAFNHFFPSGLVNDLKEKGEKVVGS